MMINAALLSYVIHAFICIYKDFWTFPGNVSFRGKKRLSCFLFVLCMIGALFFIIWRTFGKGESLTLVSGRIQLFINLAVLLFIQNGFSHYARYEIYWVGCQSIVLFILMLVGAPYVMAGEVIDDFVNIELMFWEYVHIILTYFLCRWAWKRKILHQIPQEFCNCFMITVVVLMVTSPEGIFDAYMVNIRFSIIQIEIIVCTIMTLILIWGIVRLERARMYRLKYFYDYFYQYTARLQRKMGILRHDFANYQQVLMQVSGEGREDNNFMKRLEEMYREVEIPRVTGFAEGDRFFMVYLALAEKLGHHIEICWEAEKKEIDERLMMQCMEELCMPFRRKSCVLYFREKQGRVSLSRKRVQI